MTLFYLLLRLPSWAPARRTLDLSCPTSRSFIHILTKRHNVRPRPSFSLPKAHCRLTPVQSISLRFASSKAQPSNSSSRRSKKRPVIIALALTAVLLIYLGDSSRQPLNTTTFVPFTIVSREQVSPTAFILTVRPSDTLPSSNAAHHILDLVRSRLFFQPTIPERNAQSWASLVKEIWDRGATWSVEVKQPQLQVARDYTPLPPRIRDGQDAKDQERSYDLRFLIRKMEGGEVSNYLSGLEVGDQIELRGPHFGFDVRKRLGGKGRIVFLAGGTGIAPALQVVKAVLDGGRSSAESRVDIIWANRHRADCIGCPLVKDTNGSLEAQRGGPILDQLAEMQRKYPGRVTVRCTVDEERSFVQIGALAELVRSGSRAKGKMPESKDCWLHSQEEVARGPAADIDAVEASVCQCGSGKNIIFVSGPDGFVAHFAGAKRWADGMELQGPVGGILGKMRTKYPGALDDWLVLKL